MFENQCLSRVLQCENMNRGLQTAELSDLIVQFEVELKEMI